MTKKKSNDHIRFIAIYEDGSRHPFSIPSHTVRTGDHVARIIASERQAKSELPPGKINSVERSS